MKSMKIFTTEFTETRREQLDLRRCSHSQQGKGSKELNADVTRVFTALYFGVLGGLLSFLGSREFGMRHGGFVGLFIVLAVLAAGCAGQGNRLRMFDAGIVPAELYPGEKSGLVTVQVRDKRGVIARIDGTIEGYTSRDTDVVHLTDDGKDFDRVAGDGIWSWGVEVPFTAPAGEYVLELRAYDADGKQVAVETSDGGTVPLTESVRVVILNPEE